jgi:iron complex transport system ATP-binding protein
LLKNVAKETGKGILLSTHELELAIQVADTIWLIDNKNHLLVDTPEDLVLKGEISATFQSDTVNFDPESGSFRIENKTTKEVNLTSVGNDAFWTKQALEKEGYKITTDKNTRIHISIKRDKWELKTKQQNTVINSIEELLLTLNQIV